MVKLSDKWYEKFKTVVGEKKRGKGKKKPRQKLQHILSMILFHAVKTEADRFVRLRDCFSYFFFQIYTKYYDKYKKNNEDDTKIMKRIIATLEPHLLDQSKIFAKLIKPLFRKSTTTEIASDAFVQYYKNYFTVQAKRDLNIDQDSD